MDITTTLQRPTAGRAVRGSAIAAFASAVVLVLMAVAPISASPQTMAPACAGVNLRTSATTSAQVKTSLGLANTLTVSGTVTGKAWGTNCPGWKAASTWYSVTHVNGRPVSALYGVSVLYAATGVLAPAADRAPTLAPTSAPTLAPTSAPTAPSTNAPTTAPAATTAPTAAPVGIIATPACSGINLRTGTSTGTALKVSLGLANTVTVTGTVAGAAWGTTCPTWKSGSTWYRITHVNGTPVATLYGTSALYAATGILNAATPPVTPAPPSPGPTATPTSAPSAPPTVAPTSAPTAPPTTGPSAAPSAATLVPACSSVNLRTGATTGTPIKVKADPNDTLTITRTISGGAWSTVCPTPKSGSGWYVVSQVNGQSVGSLYGVSALYAATGVLTPPTAPSTTGMTMLGVSTVFYGRGYGHGVGLSQYGARGRALAGQTAAEILAHYYPGTTIGTIPVDTQIRVLLMDNFVPTASGPLVIYGRGGTWTVGGIDLQIPAEARVRIFAPAGTLGWRAVVDSDTGVVLFDGPAPSDFVVTPTGAATTIQVFSKPSINDLYRGLIRVKISDSSLDVINVVPLESYLGGVVPSEMPSTWPVEARTAQTIAARSYAAYHLVSGGTFDVYDDTRSQAYLGVRRELADADAVVAATAGQVVKSGSAVANALFHSTAGGWTENNENVYVSATGARVAGIYSYLRGSSDRDPSGASYDAGAPYATWQTRAYTVAQLSSWFAADARTNVGTIVALDLRNRGVSGRLISVTLIGSAGTKIVSGDIFIGVFNAHRPLTDTPLRSTLLDVAPIP